MIIPHVSEKYKCQDCVKEYKLMEVNRFWVCPDCFKPISIKYQTSNFDYNAHRLKPKDVRVGQSVILHREHEHDIIDIVQDGNIFTIALAKYGLIKVNKDDYIYVIDGAWSE